MKLADLSHLLCFCQGLRGEEREKGREEEWGKEGMGRWEFTWESLLKNLHRHEAEVMRCSPVPRSPSHSPLVNSPGF